jgi:transcriptional regulator with GAF, ATPase, and Fis domain
MTIQHYPLLHRIDTGAEYPFTGRIVTIGSARECTVCIEEPGFAKRAAHAVFGKGVYLMQPLQKQTACFVNGAAIREHHALAHNDRVTIGSVDFEYREYAALPASTPSSTANGPGHTPTNELIGIVVALLKNRDQNVYEDLVASVSRLLRCDAARLVTEDRENRTTIARYPAYAGLDRFSVRAIDWARQASRAVLAQAADWQDEDDSPVSLEKNFVASVICAPLKDDERLLGYLYLDRLKSSEAFTENDRALCDVLAPLFSQILVNDDERRRQRETIERLQSGALRGDGGIVFESPAMATLLTQAKTFAATDSPVLVLGETGTGKELLVRFIHQQSARAARPFRAVNCGAIPENIMESELFGHEKGAFTGANQRKIGLVEAADGGTVFLDEIGEMPLHLQVKLLRFLQESEIMRVGATEPVRVDIRVITATNRTLETEVGAGRFRQDLLFRLNVLSLTLPPLRERGSDIEALAEFFAVKYCERFGLPRKTLSAGALKILHTHTWPGNIRELENVIQRTVLTATHERIEAPDIAFPVGVGRNIGGATAHSLAPLRAIRDEAEKTAVITTLAQCIGNVSQAAKELQIDRKCLMKKMAEFGVDANDYRP